jgi:hypothetical protein
MGEEFPVPVGLEDRSDPEPVWTWWGREKCLSLPGIEPRSYSTKNERNFPIIASTDIK